MDAIEPILPNPSILPEVRATERARPAHRDGHKSGGEGRQRHRRDEEEAVEVDVEGLEDDLADTDGSVLVAELPVAHRIDLTADDDGEPSAHQIDLTADGEDEPPVHRIDFSA